MDQLLQDIIAGVNQQSGLGGWAAVVGSLGVAVSFAIRFFKIRWPNRFGRLHPVVQFALPFIAATVGAFIIGIGGAMAAGVAVGPLVGKLLIAAVAAGVTAIGTHQGTKTAGLTFDMMSVKRDPNYEPKAFRKIMSIAVDTPQIKKAKKKLNGG